MDQANALPTPIINNVSLSSKQRSHIPVPQEIEVFFGRLVVCHHN